MEVKSTITLQEFAQAMQALDLSSVPPERHKQAVAAHFFRVMTSTMADKAEAMAAAREREALARQARIRNDYGRTKDALRVTTGGIILP